MLLLLLLARCAVTAFGVFYRRVSRSPGKGLMDFVGVQSRMQNTVLLV